MFTSSISNSLVCESLPIFSNSFSIIYITIYIYIKFYWKFKTISPSTAVPLSIIFRGSPYQLCSLIIFGLLQTYLQLTLLKIQCLFGSPSIFILYSIDFLISISGLKYNKEWHYYHQSSFIIIYHLSFIIRHLSSIILHLSSIIFHPSFIIYYLSSSIIINYHQSLSQSHAKPNFKLLHTP